jgi:hypothetical protein
LARKCSRENLFAIRSIHVKHHALVIRNVGQVDSQVGSVLLCGLVDRITRIHAFTCNLCGDDDDFISLAGTVRLFACGLILERLLIVKRVKHAVSSYSHDNFLDVGSLSNAQLCKLFIRESLDAVLFDVGFLLPDKKGLVVSLQGDVVVCKTFNELVILVLFVTG